jgi:hypothetical protein
MGFIAALFLLFMNEEDAFWLLVAVMNGEKWQLRGVFQDGLPRVMLWLYQFERLMEQLLPLIWQHFRSEEVMVSSFASQWFITVFSSALPLATLLRVWDLFLASGPLIVFRVALALLHQAEQRLLSLPFDQLLPELCSLAASTHSSSLSSTNERSTSFSSNSSAISGGSGAPGDALDAARVLRTALSIQIPAKLMRSFEQQYRELNGPIPSSAMQTPAPSQHIPQSSSLPSPPPPPPPLLSSPTNLSSPLSSPTSVSSPPPSSASLSSSSSQFKHVNKGNVRGGGSATPRSRSRDPISAKKRSNALPRSTIATTGADTTSSSDNMKRVSNVATRSNSSKGRNSSQTTSGASRSTTLLATPTPRGSASPTSAVATRPTSSSGGAKRPSKKSSSSTSTPRPPITILNNAT